MEENDVWAILWPFAFKQKLTRDEIMISIEDKEWQKVRLRLKGTSTEHKVHECRKFLERRQDRAAEVCVVNYINALKRGGQIATQR